MPLPVFTGLHIGTVSLTIIICKICHNIPSTLWDGQVGEVFVISKFSGYTTEIIDANKLCSLFCVLDSL